MIGAGLGGLTAAVRLARAGKSVILLERHNIPGGYATTFVRGEFEFDISLHALSGVGSQEKPGSTRTVLEQMGVADKIEFIKLPYLGRVLSGDVDVLVPVDWQGFEDAIISASPSGVDQIRALLAVIRQRFVDLYPGQMTPNDSAVNSTYDGMTLAEVVDHFQLDRKARQVLLAISDYFGSSPLLQGFDAFAVGVGDYLEYGAYYIRGKSQALANALLETFKEHGGQVVFNNAVGSIQVVDGRVTGVTTERGDVFEVDAVFSNADPLTTCQMASEGSVSRGYVQELGARPLTMSIVGVYMAVNKTADELGLVTSETFICEADDDEALALKHGFAPSGIEVSCHDHTYPGNSPSGTSTLTLVAASFADQWLRLTPDQYFEAKRRYAEKILDTAERYFPGLREYCISIEVSTPLTHMRFASTRGGAIYGFECGPGDDGLGFRSPVRGLYYVGAWSLGGGYEPALMSGFLAAEAALAAASDEGPEHEVAGAPSQEEAPHPLPTTSRGVERECVESIHPSSMQLQIVEVITETVDSKTLRCIRVDGPIPPFQAGQYLSLELNVRGTKVSRPYTPSSAPGQDWIDLTVVDKPGGFCAPYLLNDVSVGDVLTSSGFNGSFFYEPLIDGTNLVLIGGGCGITPFMSIIRDLLRKNDHDLSVLLLYGSRTPEHEVFGDELRLIADQADWLTVRSVVSEPDASYEGLTGFIDAEFIRTHVGDLDSKTFYVCGPSPMYAAISRSLESLGVPRHRVRLELHGPPENIAAQPGWPVDIGADDEFQVSVGDVTITARSGEPLLNSLERHGLSVPARCRSGECSYCRVKVVSGDTYSAQTAHPREADRDFGYVHSCCAYPLSDLHIELDSR